MRIGLIYHQFRSDAGGLERYLKGFAEHLSDEGHELVLVGSSFDDAFTSIKDAQLHEISCSGTKSKRMRQFAERSAAGIAELGVDVTLGFGRTYAQDLHRAGGGCHKVYSRFLPAHKRLRPKNRIELDLEEKLYRGAETRHFVVNSTLVGQQLEHEYGVPDSRITTIHTPVDATRFAPAENRAAAKAKICESLGTDPERPACLFVSLNHRRKGLAALLKVWGELDADLWIAGKPLRSAQKRLIQSRGTRDQIHVLGQTGDVVSYYQAADGFLHPTLYDACANTVLQSMSCGLPGLISSRDGASEFVRDGENGFLLGDPTNSSEVLRGIRRILDLSSRDRVRVAAAARQTVAPLTWAVHLEKWRAAIGRILKK